MHADITRDTFDPTRHFSRVLMQQGRVPLDADLNEQSSILLHYLRTLAADLLGPAAGPRDALGFGIGYANNEVRVSGPGRYYVNGMLCEIEAEQRIPVDTLRSGVNALGQPLPPLKPPFLVYLEVWEQLVTAYHQPLLREAALGGPDTAARAQVTWRVRAESLDGVPNPTCETGWNRVRERIAKEAERGGLAVRAGGAQTDTLDPCVLPPDARYRGMENQLYRVEIHTAGRVGPGQPQGPPTFKWSRENGSVIFAIRSLRGVEAEVETLGLDPRLDLGPGDWVEIVDDRLAGAPGMLARVADVDREELRVVLEDTPGNFPEYDDSHAGIHPLLRRWDQSDPVIVRPDASGGGAAKGTLVNGAVRADPGWIELESGISVKFEAGRSFLPGDYWLVPARVATGDVEWPRNGTGPATLPARRAQRYYAPLGVVRDVNKVTDCRRCIDPPLGAC